MPLPVIYLTATMLLLAVLPFPYGYYTLLRLVATAVFGSAAYISYKREDRLLPWVFGFMALLFNPFFKVYLDKPLWVLIDMASALVLLAAKDQIRDRPQGPRD